MVLTVNVGEVAEREGELPKSVILRCRVRSFSDGAILG